MNCLSVFDHFVGLALEGLKLNLIESTNYMFIRILNYGVHTTPLFDNIKILKFGDFNI